MSRITIALLVGSILLGGATMASAQGQDKASTVAGLEKRRTEAARQYTMGRKQTASDYRKLSDQRARVQKLIDRLEAGESVAPQDIDRAVAVER